jgi:MFS transporter, DHA2 family, methylenomycin A resistance protein
VIGVAASAAIAVILVDVASVALLLPTIRLDLGSSSSGAAWVIGAHLLALAALLPLGARLGRGRVAAAAGGVLMATGAVVCATADSTAVLVTGRALQGAGGAAVLGSLAGSAQRGRAAFALPALTVALGPLVGGVFAELNWWRVYFWAGVPLAGVAATAALLAARPAARSEPHQLPRLLALAAGLGAIAIALIQAEDWSWGWWTALLVAGAVCIRAARPPAPAALAATAGYAFGCIAALAFLMPEYFELVRHLSGLRSGALLLALTVPAVSAWTLVRAIGRPSAGPPVAAAGALCTAAGLAVLATLDPGTGYALAAGGLLLVGIGLGAAVGTAPGADDSAAAVGWTAAGTALLFALAAEAFQHAEAHDRSGGASFEHALATGVAWAAIILLLPLAAAVALTWRSRPGRSAARPAGASSRPPRRPA